jgi:hypothetical protein
MLLLLLLVIIVAGWSVAVPFAATADASRRT